MNADKYKLVFVIGAIAVAPLFAQKDPLPSGNPGTLPNGVRPPQLEGVGVDEHLGQEVDLDLTFTAKNGYPVALRDFFNKGKPVVLDLVYYQCPMLCNL